MLKNYTNLSDFFRKAALRPLNIVSAVFAQLIFGFFVMPKTQELISPDGKNVILDLRFGYSTEKAWEYLNTIGSSGRNYYFYTETFFDLIFTIIYSIAYCLLLSLFFQKAFSKSHYLQYFNVFPLLLGLADILENIGIITLIKSFPNKLVAVSQFASAMSLLKWGCTLFNLLLMLTGLIAWALITAVRKK